MKNTINLAYYSHSKLSYNTDTELQHYNFLKTITKGFIICPNKHLGDIETTEVYQRIITKVDCVFVSENNGFIGKGSYNECLAALVSSIPVFVIKNDNDNFKLEIATKVIQISDYNLFDYGQLKSKIIISIDDYFTI